MHTRMQKSGPVSRESCCSRSLHMLQSLQSRVCWAVAIPNQLFWNSNSGCRSTHHAVACEREAESVRSYRQCCVEGDAAQSALCAYVALLALAGLAINTMWHVKWADPIAAMLIIPLILREGW